jgi:hypothetical protein
MAKGNLLLGMGRGKLGDIVLYRQNGQQMSRPRTRVVKNPRTSGQQIQRMIQATIAYGYAGLKTIVDHSFEGVQYGQRSMSYFMKRNMDALRAKVIAESNGTAQSAFYAIPNVRVLYPNEYVVSNGSLAPCPSPARINAVSQDVPYALEFETSGIGQNLTLSKMMEFFGASAGDQLTFLILNQDQKGTDEVAALNGEHAYANALAVRRIKFRDSYSSEELASAFALSLCDDEVTSSDVAVSSAAGQGNSGFLYVYVPSFGANRYPLGACVIRSRKSGDNWLRSPQTMWIDPEVFNRDDKIGFSLTTAYNAWMSGTTPVGVSEYILNGKPNTDVWPTVPDEDEPEP